MSSLPNPPSILTWVILLPLLFIVDFVKSDTQMCRRFSRTAETRWTTPNETSCLHMWVTGGRHYNSLNIYVEIDRKKSTSPSCEIPTGLFYLSLQVFNELGYPVGDPTIGFQKTDKNHNICLPKSTTSYYARDADLEIIPCFFDQANQDNYMQNVPKGLKPGVLGLITPNIADVSSRDLFHFRATWHFSQLDLSAQPKRPKELYVVGELFDPINDKYLQFSALEWISFGYLYQSSSVSPKVNCKDNPSITPLPFTRKKVFFTRTRSLYAKTARENLPEFEYSIPGVNLQPNQPTSEPPYLLGDQYSCLQLKRDVFRIAESPDSLRCIRLDVFPSRSGINQVRLKLSYEVGSGTNPLCTRWRPQEWLIQGYDGDGSFYPSGSPSRLSRSLPGSFIHYSDAGELSGYLYKCNMAFQPPNFVKMLDDFKNLPCPYTSIDQDKWSQEINSTTMPTIAHTVSTEFFASNDRDGMAVWYLWKFMPLNDLDPNAKRPKLLNFMVEAYLPHQHLVLVLRAQQQVEMIRYTEKSPAPGNKETKYIDEPCNADDTEENQWFKYVRKQGTRSPVVDLPDTSYVESVCDTNRDKCEDLQRRQFKRVGGNLQSCRLWRPEVPRYPVFDCYPELTIRPGRQENSVLIYFRVSTSCLLQFPPEDFIIGAYNEEGYPVGKLSSSFDVQQERHKCKYIDPNKKVAFTVISEYANVDCFYDSAHTEKYIQDVSKTSMPTLFYGKLGPLPSAVPKGTVYLMWRVVWEYSQPRNYGGKHPKEIFFMAEVYTPKRSQVIAIPGSNSVLLNYIDSPKENPYSDCSRSADDSSPQNSVVGNPSNKKDTPGDETYGNNCKNDPTCIYSYVPTTTTPTPATTTTAPGTGLPVVPVPPVGPVPVVPGGPAPPPEPPHPRKKHKKPSNVYEGCVERTKGCVVPPKGTNPRECLKKHTCDLVIAFQRQDMIDDSKKNTAEDFVVLEMYHQDPGEWFAIGLNPSYPRMADSYVVECVDEGFAEGPVIYNSRNLAGGKYENKRYSEEGPEAAHVIIDKQESYRRGREIYCRFHIKVQFSRSVGSSGTSGDKRFFDLQKMPFYVIAAWGTEFFSGPKGNLRKHKPLNFMRPPEGAKYKTVLGARYAPSPVQKPLIVSHGVVMLWVVLFCLPLGSFIGRYYKETFHTFQIRTKKIPLWLILHVLVMTVGVGLFIYAMWSEVEGHKKWVSLRKSKLHTWLGGATGGLFLLNFLLGCISKVSVFGHKNPTGVAHGLLGHGTFLLSLILVFRMDDVSFGNAPCIAKYIAGALAFTYFVIYGAMTYHYRWVDWIVGLRTARGAFAVIPIKVLTEKAVTELVDVRRSRELVTRGYIADKNKEDTISAPGRNIRVAGLVLLTLLALMYVGWNSIIITYNHRGPCIPLDQFHD